MEEIIVRVTRALASMPRLRLLSCLARADEMTPTALARQVEMPLNVVSTHLSALSAAGLMQRRRSGSWCYCSATSPYSDRTLSGRITCWLRECLRDPKAILKDCGVRELRNSPAAEIEGKLHGILFEALTAFTNVRRLQILRKLLQGGTVTAQMLCEELHMSEYAVSRHTSKLVRRGYAECDDSGPCRVFRLSPNFKTPIHQTLLSIVRQDLKRE